MLVFLPLFKNFSNIAARLKSPVLSAYNPLSLVLFQWGSAAHMLWHFRQHACLSVRAQSFLVSSSKRAFRFLALTYSNLSPELRSAAGPRLAFSYAESAKEKDSWQSYSVRGDKRVTSSLKTKYCSKWSSRPRGG